MVQEPVRPSRRLNTSFSAAANREWRARERRRLGVLARIARWRRYRANYPTAVPNPLGGHPPTSR